MSTDERYRRARDLYGSGALSEAHDLLIMLAAEQPRDLSVLLLLGAVASHLDPPSAARWFEQARDVDPRSPDAWKGLGLAYRQQDRLDQAMAAYERALTLDPRDAETLVNFAVALRTTRSFDRAAQHLEQAIKLQPRLTPAYLNLGNVLLDKDELDRAGAAYLQALKLNPRATAAALGLSKVFRAQKKLDMAEKTLQAATRLVPDAAELLGALGDVQHELDRDDEALATLDTALKMAPRNLTVLHYAGRVRRHRREWSEAERLHRLAFDIVPDDPDTLVNLGATLIQTGKREEAARIFARARELYPEDAEVRFSCALALLTDSQFAEGWPDYIYRTRTKELHAARFCHLPRLERLSDDAGKIVIWGDQGVGDEIIYGGFLQDFRKDAGRIVCEIDRRLLPLFRRGFPEFTFVERSFSPQLPRTIPETEAARVWRSATLDPQFAGATHQIALPDLGGLVRNDVASFPRHNGYLRADPERVAAYHRMLNKQPGQQILGISWRSQRGAIGRAKSAGLVEIVQTFAAEGVRFVSLQYGDVREDLEAVRAAGLGPVEVIPGLDYFNDIDGLAALIAACDTVVTVSNVTAHLAGAQGKVTGLLCSTWRPWYWLRGGVECPWYPAMQIFRQEREGSWADALSACRDWVRQR